MQNSPSDKGNGDPIQMMDAADAQIQCAILESVERQAIATAKALERVLSLMEIVGHAATARQPHIPSSARKRRTK